jgi:hypothetical protein
VPTSLVIQGEVFAVRSWAEVARQLGAYIANLGDETFDVVASEMPKYFGRDATKFRPTSKLARLPNNAYIETNLSAAGIMRAVRKALACVGIDSDEWEVMRESDTNEERATTKALRLQFWTGMRDALAKAGSIPHLFSPTGNAFYTIKLGRPGIVLRLSASFVEARISSKVQVEENIADAFFTALVEEREAIEREVGCALEWDPNPKSAVRTVGISKSAQQLVVRENWPAVSDELASLATKMYGAFAARVASLPR